ncbi:MAG: phosphatase PAP2 family protein [Gammaproteobacteria bacterium]|nr:phosphatase PAP2 family protein [Gammaproteobacteria bacterium]
MRRAEYIAGELNRRLLSCRLRPGAGSGMVLGVGLGAAAIGLIGLLLGGYHAGFLAANRLLAMLPADAVQIITYAGDSLVALTLLLYFARRAPTLLWHGTLAAALAALISQLLKFLLHTARPPAVIPHDALRIIGPAYTSHAFPSGHATTAFTAAALIVWGLRSTPARSAVFAAAALVGVSRIAAGVHWPLDVLAGAAIGCVSVALAAPLAQRWRWGVSLRGHLLLVIILTGCALSLWLIRIPYPAATLPAHALALGALGLTAWDYLWTPLGRRR